MRFFLNYPPPTKNSSFSNPRLEDGDFNGDQTNDDKGECGGGAPNTREGGCDGGFDYT